MQSRHHVQLVRTGYTPSHLFQREAIIMIYRILLSLLLFVSVAACETATVGRVDWDREADVAAYRSYAWISDHPLIVAEGSSMVINPLTEGRVKVAVDRQLSAKGFDRVAVGGDADLQDTIRYDLYLGLENPPRKFIHSGLLF